MEVIMKKLSLVSICLTSLAVFSGTVSAQNWNCRVLKSEFSAVIYDGPVALDQIYEVLNDHVVVAPNPNVPGSNFFLFTTGIAGGSFFNTGKIDDGGAVVTSDSLPVDSGFTYIYPEGNLTVVCQ
jgi:hypothetical protein